MTLPPPTHPSIRLKQLDTHARKRFGQNFLASEGTVAGIVRAAGFQPGATVLEIGPGLGNLTRALLEAGADLTAVELDRDLAAALSEWFGELPNLRIIQGDAAKQSWPDLFPQEKRPVTCVANLPYNVGTGLLQGLVAAPHVFSELVVMLQREVADRLLAQPGDRDRGSLSAWIQARASVRLALKVPPGAFVPAPKVHSAVVHLKLFPQPQLDGLPEAHVERVTRQAFSQPRKTLRRSLSGGFPMEQVDAALLTAAVDGSLRPADLQGAELLRLAAALLPASVDKAP